jgi:hypothetical protein
MPNEPEFTVRLRAKTVQDACRHSPTITVLIPCFNEELTIEKVIDDFRVELPQEHRHKLKSRVCREDS